MSYRGRVMMPKIVNTQEIRIEIFSAPQSESKIDHYQIEVLI